MPLILREQTYVIPGEGGTKNVTGREFEVIERFFDVDGITLFAALRPLEGVTPGPGITRQRALYALAWVALHRADESVTLDGIMDEYGIDELEMPPEKLEDEADPKEESPLEDQGLPT